MSSKHPFILIAAIFGFLGVASGAFGAHALKKVLEPDLLSVFETGSRYCLHHAMVLLATALYLKNNANRWLIRACWSFTIGTTIFSGTLWVLAISGMRWLGAITPLGGTALLIGWGCLGMFAITTNREQP